MKTTNSVKGINNAVDKRTNVVELRGVSYIPLNRVNFGPQMAEITSCFWPVPISRFPACLQGGHWTELNKICHKIGSEPYLK